MSDVLNFHAFPDPTIRNAALAAAGPADVVESGWIPPERRDPAMVAAHAIATGQTPNLAVYGTNAYADATKVGLWECWKLALGKDYAGVHQITGSCVGAAGGNALFSLAAADVVRRRDPELAVVPFWLLPYGLSRKFAGIRGRGEGSFGSTFAKAVREYGHVKADEQGLPTYTDRDGLVWGSNAEYEWSDGAKISESWLTKAKPYLVRSTALCRSTDDVRDAIKAFYPVTIASNWGGLMKCPVKGTGANTRLVNRRATTWMHQMSVHGWEDNPELGELFYVLNQWGLDAHGRCPSGAPPGGFWVDRATAERMLSVRDSYSVEFDGFDHTPQQVMQAFSIP